MPKIIYRPNPSPPPFDPPTPPTPTANYLTFTAVEAGCRITLRNRLSPDPVSIEYSLDGNTWQPLELSTPITLENIGDSVKFRGINETISKDSTNYYYLYGEGKLSASGDVTSLLNGLGGDVAVPAYAFNHLFYASQNLLTPPNLPSLQLAEGCYSYMFMDCKALTTAPQLPATNLANRCYMCMFYDCKALASMPELPASVLYEYCYTSMFAGCLALTTTTTNMPVTTLAKSCMSSMFQGCTALEEVRFALSCTTLFESCYKSMFSGCSALLQAPALPATTLAKSCYSSMFTDCTSLTQAPILPALNLVENCYQYMFQGCTALNYIKAMFTTTPSNTYTDYWVYRVAASGIFVKNVSASWDVTGNNGVPSGWTVETSTE